jgi:hypothetical protein
MNVAPARALRADGEVLFSHIIHNTNHLRVSMTVSSSAGISLPPLCRVLARRLTRLLVTTIGLAAFSRADTPPAERRDFFVYIDEFQSFTTLALANMLSELRKYRVGFTVAHQYLNQLEPDVRHAVLDNTGSIISFRVGVEDAPYLVREFHERFAEIDLLQLPNYRIYLKLMIDGTPSTPFSAVTLDPAIRH